MLSSRPAAQILYGRANMTGRLSRVLRYILGGNTSRVNLRSESGTTAYMVTYDMISGLNNQLLLIAPPPPICSEMQSAPYQQLASGLRPCNLQRQRQSQRLPLS